jgi:hypothetical protein
LSTDISRLIAEAVSAIQANSDAAKKNCGLAVLDKKAGRVPEEPETLRYLKGVIGAYPDDTGKWRRIRIVRSPLRNTLVIGQKGSGKDSADLTLRFVEKRDLRIPQHVVGEDTGEHVCTVLPNMEPWFDEQITLVDEKRGDSYLFVDRGGSLIEPEGDIIKYVVPYSESFLESDIYATFPHLFEVVRIPVNTFFDMRDQLFQLFSLQGQLEQRVVLKAFKILQGRDKKLYEDYHRHRQMYELGEIEEEPVDYLQFKNDDPDMDQLLDLIDTLMEDPRVKGIDGRAISGLGKLERYRDLNIFCDSSDPMALTLDRMIRMLNDAKTTYYYSCGWLGYDDFRVNLIFFLYIFKLISKTKLDPRYRDKVPELIRISVPEMHRYAPHSLTPDWENLQRPVRRVVVNAYKEWRKYGLIPSGNDQRADMLDNQILSEVSEVIIKDIVPMDRILNPIMDNLRIWRYDYKQRDRFVQSVSMKIDEMIYGFVNPFDQSYQEEKAQGTARTWRKGVVMPTPCMKAPPAFDFFKLVDRYENHYGNYEAPAL